MTKEQFLFELRRRLSAVPESEAARSLEFYAESIDDRIEDGMPEEEAVAAMGSIDEIVREIESSLPLSTIVKQRVETERSRGHSALWIVLAIIGFPVWFPLLIAAAAVLLSVYIVIWAVIISLFAALLALAVSAVALIIYVIIKIAPLGFYGVLMVLGAALALIGLMLLLFVPVKALAKALVRGTGSFWRWCKRKFVGMGRR